MAPRQLAKGKHHNSLGPLTKPDIAMCPVYNIRDITMRPHLLVALFRQTMFDLYSKDWYHNRQHEDCEPLRTRGRYSFPKRRPQFHQGSFV